MRRAIVLSGGGGRGAYQIGVWKALRKLHIRYHIVTGTSVGALNGAYMVQRDYIKALSVWENMNFNRIYSTSINDNIETFSGKKQLVTMYAKGIMIDGGMEIKNLEYLIDRTLKEKKFRKSSVDYGLVTYNLTNFCPVILTKNQIPPGKIKDYLLASATCFPVFKKREINQKTFIDGGFYDNLPINLALDMGADEIIAVDLKAVGMKRKVKDNIVPITFIAPRNHIHSFLVFDEKSSRRAIQLGYNDTMKTFKKLDGDVYTFNLNDLYKNYNTYNNDFMFIIQSIFQTYNNDSVIDRFLAFSTFNKIFRDSTFKEKFDEFNRIIEYLGKIFDIEEENIYRISVYNSILLQRLNKFSEKVGLDIEEEIKFGKIKELLNTKLIVKYIYDKIVKINLKTDKKKEICSLAFLFSKEFLGAVYLFTIQK